jgi:phthalate 4,5-cis-dihydrodiol dehydrogenase
MPAARTRDDASRRLRLGVAGLGRAFMLMLPTFKAHPRVELVAAADLRADARARFERDFGAKTHESVTRLAADEDVDAIYIATPHQHHAQHAIEALAGGKHVLVEKPMALSLEEATAMIGAARSASAHLVVGHSHSFDAPVRRAREIIASGAVGRVRMITALNFTDFLYRPRRPEELDTRAGGGVIFSQAAHQVDVVRLLAGGLASRVRAHTGTWDPERPTEGAYTALLTFADGAVASLTYSGYGHFDSDEMCGWVSELGRARDENAYGAARRALAKLHGVEAEAAAKNARAYGGADANDGAAEAPWHEHFGMVIASCEKGDVRPTPKGVMVYGDATRDFEPLEKPAVPRAEVIDELCDAALLGRPAVHDGDWGRATFEVCLAMLRSARDGAEIALSLQGPTRDRI